MTESINEISKDNHRLKTENQQLNALNQQLNKTEQLLKSTNQQLMADEEELRIVHNDLIERVRELNCMFGMSELVEQHDLTLYDFFTQLVQLIPPAWKYPDITCARITFDSKEYNTNNFKPTRWMLSAAINVSGQKAGVIEVCYLKEMPMIDEGPFLKQERILLDAMAHRSGELIEHRKTTEQMNAAVQQLKASNQQLQAAEQQLRASNQQLKAGQQQLTSANQQLRATEQQLRASNQQLKADEQQLISANQQLKAAEQQLRASNQQLIADEQQLNAANQQLKANEKELRHSRARYKAMFDFTMSGIAVYEGINNGNNFVIRDFNPAAEKIEKVSKQDIMARDVQDVFPGIQKMGLLDVFKRVWKTGKAELFPLVQYKDDRIEGWRENFVFKLPSGELVAIFKDLTKLKQTEEALIDNEARLSTIMNNLPDMSYQCKNDEHWTMLFVNDACKQLTGYQPAQLIDNKDVSYNDLIHPDDKTFVRQQVDQAINAGKPYELEYRIISADGKVKWVWERGGQRISHDNQNVLEGLIRDITGRKRMEKMLRDSERRNLTLLEGSPVCNKIIDLDSRLLYMSAAGVKQLKIPDIKPYYGKPYSPRFHPESMRIPFNEHLERAKTGEISSVVTSVLDMEGGKVWYDTTFVPARDDEGRIEYIIATSVDITKRKQAEKSIREMALFAELNPAPVMRVNKEKVILSCNPASKQILGAKAVEGELICSVLPSFFNIDLDECITHSQVLTHETAIDGNYYQFVIRGIADLSLANIYGSDITKRKEQDALLDARLKLSEASLDHSIDGLIKVFLDEAEKLTGSEIGFFHFVEDDQATVRLQTWSTNTLENMCTAESKGMHYPISEAGVWADCVKERRPVIHNDYASLTNKKGLPKGHATVIRELLVPVIRGGKIKVILGVGNKETNYNKNDVDITSVLADMVWDIIERKHAEEELRQSREQLSKFMESATDGFMLFDSQLNHIEINKAALDIISQTRDDVINKNITEIVPNIKQSGRYDKYMNVIRTGKPVMISQFKSHPKFGNKHIELKAFKVGQGLGMILNDITHRIIAEKQIRDNQERLRALTARMSSIEEREKKRIAEGIHDSIIQPLVFLDVKMKSLRTAASDNKTTESCDQMRTILGDLIKQSRSYIFDLSHPILYELGLEAALEEWLQTEIIYEHGLSIDLQVKTQTKDLEHGLLTFLFKSARELLINIVKHAKANNVNISVARKQDNIILCVKDDGCGFDEESFQIKHDKTSGFGLFNIREQLTYMGGNIKIISKPGQGSEIVLTVPSGNKTLI